MNNLLNNFDWSSLYQKYDSMCRRFIRDAPLLRELDCAPSSDRELYYYLVDRVAKERRDSGKVSLYTYQAMLYWKLYSQPQALAGIATPVRDNEDLQEKIEGNLQTLGSVLPLKVDWELTAIRYVFGCVDRHSEFIRGMINSNALPMRSTFLHFHYPDIIPILDKQVLLAVGVNDPNATGKEETLEKYIQFTWSLLQTPNLIPRDWTETPLRLIDMAFWITRATSSKREDAAFSPGHANTEKNNHGKGKTSSQMIEAWITNVADQAQRQRTGPRFELCFSKDHWDLFPGHKDFFTMFVDGNKYRMSIGKRERVAHLYVHTWCYDRKGVKEKITQVLQSAGLKVGDHLSVKVWPGYQFELIT